MEWGSYHFCFLRLVSLSANSSSIPCLNQLRPALQGIGKKTAWKTILEENHLQLQLSKFDGDSVLNESTLRSGEELLCTSYSPKECFAKAHDVRNYLFFLKNNKSEELPPTVDSLSHHIRQANYRTYVWKQAILSMLCHAFCVSMLCHAVPFCAMLPPPDGSG